MDKLLELADDKSRRLRLCIAGKKSCLNPGRT